MRPTLPPGEGAEGPVVAVASCFTALQPNRGWLGLLLLLAAPRYAGAPRGSSLPSTPPVLAFVDVHYTGNAARAACALATGWDAWEPARSWTVEVAPVEPYVPGAFYRRELPCLLAVLSQAPRVDAVVIDGYVWLDAAGTPGLGAHLFAALDEEVPVVGIAKTAFKGSPMAQAVLRRSSTKPLYVTAAGLESRDVAVRVASMQGAARVPNLVAYVDRLARGLQRASD